MSFFSHTRTRSLPMSGFWYSTRQVLNSATCPCRRSLGMNAAVRFLNHVENRWRA